MLHQGQASAEKAGITQSVYQLGLESVVVIRVSKGLVVFDLSPGCSSPMIHVLDSSLASMETMSSEFSVALCLACFHKTSSHQDAPPKIRSNRAPLVQDQLGSLAVVVLLDLVQGVVLNGLV